MELFVYGVMAAQLCVLAALYLLGQKHVRGGDGPEALPERCPRVTAIVPVTGDTPGMRQAVASLIDQDYPDYTVIFVTAQADDPAAALVAGVAGNDLRVMQVVSGPATTCGQKNHSILAGVRAAQTAEVFVFCDSTHLADRHFVSNLAAPILRGDAPMTSGFHKIVTCDGATATVGMANTCLALHLLQPIRAITQPWGGAMAISRSAFDRFGLVRLWGQNIVDDFSMGPHLHRFGVTAWPVAAACLLTPLEKVSLARWDDWLTRQLLYLKFCIPPGWLVSILAVLLLSVPPVAAFGLLAAWVVGYGSGLSAALSALYLAGFAGLGLFFRSLTPRPVGVLPWLRGYVCDVCHAGLVFWPHLCHQHHVLARHPLQGRLGRRGQVGDSGLNPGQRREKGPPLPRGAAALLRGACPLLLVAVAPGRGMVGWAVLLVLLGLLLGLLLVLVLLSQSMLLPLAHLALILLILLVQALLALLALSLPLAHLPLIHHLALVHHLALIHHLALALILRVLPLLALPPALPHLALVVFGQHGCCRQQADETKRHNKMTQ
ncbi:glycosyltransferase [Desulfovibrio sp. DV]|uniref:glycosyltransferase n=1 Tax=Desulfovibrio sp. DV TaxID=1844708 RepID=UPI000A57B81E|nr:glycosyltransferase [Desulfovibrio sp. DV]